MSGTKDGRRVKISKLLEDLGHDDIVGELGNHLREKDEDPEGYEASRQEVVNSWAGLHECLSETAADGCCPEINWQRDYFDGEALKFDNSDNDDNSIPWSIIAQLVGKEARLGLTVNYKGRAWLVENAWASGDIIGQCGPDTQMLVLLPLDRIDMEDIQLS